jgi:uncharacterized DUF497 family protein
VKFEWDPKKAASNLSKHGVSFKEALTVFADPLARIFDHEDHSTEEQREIIVGHSVSERLLLVCFRHRRSPSGSSAHGRQRSRSGKTMKKTSSRRKTRRGEMQREYRFDYRKARPTRFAPRMKGKTIAVVLDPDVASVFQSSESVNSLLRSVISVLPQPRG